ncbi:MAG: hypothetical protein KC474_09420 [Cyanobacteria bacterium HKST-UBA04]|nr:hypothetical protein [Cyanobacteria bacterium HKST-UBA04]
MSNPPATIPRLGWLLGAVLAGTVLLPLLWLSPSMTWLKMSPQAVPTFSVTPYLETVSQPVHQQALADRQLPVFNKNRLSGYSPVKVGNADFISVRVDGNSPQHEIMLLFWAGASGRYTPNMTNYRLHLWPYEPQLLASLPQSHRSQDTFSHIPVPPGATGFILTQTNPSVHRKFHVAFHRHVPQPEPEAYGFVVQRRHPYTGNQSASVFLKPVAVTDDQAAITRRGGRITLRHVAAVSWLNRQHLPNQIKISARQVLGQFSPHGLLVQMTDGSTHQLSVQGADMLELDYQAASKTLVVDASQYQALERTTLVTQVTPQLAGDVWRRVHPNLGLSKRLDAGQLQISLMRTDKPQLWFTSWHPNGRMATLIFTEHADYQETVLDSLVTFGNKQGQVIQGQGLAGNQIPFTKSVFVLGEPYPFFVTMPGGHRIGFSQDSVMGSPAFAHLLSEYRRLKLPVEFAIHTAGTRHYTTEETRQALAGLVPFNSRVWIDHGATPTMVMRGGWDRREPDHVLIDALKAFNYRYVWADGDRYAFLEDDGELSLVRDNQPANLLYNLPVLTGGFTSTEQSFTPHQLFLFSTAAMNWTASLYSDAQLKRLLANHGVTIAHVYFPYSAIQFWKTGGHQRAFRLYPWFNPTLQRLSAAHRSGRLNLDTIGHWGDYVRMARQVVLTPTPCGLWLDNPVTQTIQGYTLGLQTEEAPPAFELDGSGVKGQRWQNGQAYLWFDLPPGRHELKRPSCLSR